jgi:hypothetical protein
MNYRVKIVGPSGNPYYLWRGKEVSESNGAVYRSPSAAMRAIRSYIQKPHFMNYKVKPLVMIEDEDGNYYE